MNKNVLFITKTNDDKTPATAASKIITKTMSSVFPFK